MAVILNKRGFDYAKSLVEEGKFVVDARGAWREHRPSPEKVIEFLRAHDVEEYAVWHLGIDDDEPENSTEAYRFPYGDFEKVHRCGVLTAESKAAEIKHPDIEDAAARLHELIDEGH